MSTSSSDNGSDSYGSSSDEDYDFFSYQKTEFYKKEEVDSSPSSPTKRRRTNNKGLSSTDEALSKLERRRLQHKIQKAAAAAEDDSDVEELSPSAAAAAAEAPVIECLSSDDDEDDAAKIAMTITKQTPVFALAQRGVAKETCQRLQQARTAAYRLQQAQKYHAEDVYVPQPAVALPLSCDVVDLDSSPAASATPAAASNKDLGPTLRFSMCTRQIVNGAPTESSSTETMAIRKLELIQRLFERYQEHHAISPSQSRVSFTFDGQRMDLSKTPASYEMEDEDMIDVVVTTLTAHSSSGTSSGASLGKSLQLKVRFSDASGAVTSEAISIREKESLKSLVEKFKKQRKLPASKQIRMTFDGESLDTTKTPQSYGMEKDDIIDARH